MKIYGVFYLCISFILCWTGSAAAYPPRLPAPPASVTSGSEAVQWLWHQAHGGMFFNVLPSAYAVEQQEWSSFLRTYGGRIVEKFYREHPSRFVTNPYYGFKQFMNSVHYMSTAEVTYDVWSTKKRGLALVLVRAFAEHKQAQRIQEQAAQRRLQEINERKEWGRSLSLGLDKAGKGHS